MKVIIGDKHIYGGGMKMNKTLRGIGGRIYTLEIPALQSADAHDTFDL